MAKRRAATVGREARPVGDLLPKALERMGVASARVTRRVEAAWQAACDPAWRGRAAPVRFTGGVLIVGVSSAALRQELAQFHAARLLGVLRAALPDLSLVGVRFESEAVRPTAAHEAADEGRGPDGPAGPEGRATPGRRGTDGASS